MSSPTLPNAQHIRKRVAHDIWVVVEFGAFAIVSGVPSAWVAGVAVNQEIRDLLISLNLGQRHGRPQNPLPS